MAQMERPLAHNKICFLLYIEVVAEIELYFELSMASEPLLDDCSWSRLVQASVCVFALVVIRYKLSITGKKRVPELSICSGFVVERSIILVLTEATALVAFVVTTKIVLCSI